MADTDERIGILRLLGISLKDLQPFRDGPLPTQSVTQSVTQAAAAAGEEGDTADSSVFENPLQMTSNGSEQSKNVQNKEQLVERLMNDLYNTRYGEKSPTSRNLMEFTKFIVGHMAAGLYEQSMFSMVYFDKKFPFVNVRENQSLRYNIGSNMIEVFKQVWPKQITMFGFSVGTDLIPPVLWAVLKIALHELSILFTIHVAKTVFDNGWITYLLHCDYEVRALALQYIASLLPDKIKNLNKVWWDFVVDTWNVPAQLASLALEGRLMEATTDFLFARWYANQFVVNKLNPLFKKTRDGMTNWWNGMDFVEWHDATEFKKVAMDLMDYFDTLQPVVGSDLAEPGVISVFRETFSVRIQEQIDSCELNVNVTESRIQPLNQTKNEDIERKDRETKKLSLCQRELKILHLTLINRADAMFTEQFGKGAYSPEANTLMKRLKNIDKATKTWKDFFVLLSNAIKNNENDGRGYGRMILEQFLPFKSFPSLPAGTTWFQQSALPSAEENNIFITSKNPYANVVSLGEAVLNNDSAFQLTSDENDFYVYQNNPYVNQNNPYVNYGGTSVHFLPSEYEQYVPPSRSWDNESLGLITPGLTTSTTFLGLQFGQMLPVKDNTSIFDKTNNFFEQQIMVPISNVQKYRAGGRVHYYIAERRSERAEALLDELNQWNVLGKDEDGKYYSKIDKEQLEERKFEKEENGKGSRWCASLEDILIEMAKLPNTALSYTTQQIKMVGKCDLNKFMPKKTLQKSTESIDVQDYFKKYKIQMNAILTAWEKRWNQMRTREGIYKSRRWHSGHDGEDFAWFVVVGEDGEDEAIVPVLRHDPFKTNIMRDKKETKNILGGRREVTTDHTLNTHMNRLRTQPDSIFKIVD